MSRPINPPWWIDELIERFAPVSLAEEVKGDLYEMFLSDIDRVGLTNARRKYVINGLGFFLKSFFWKRSDNHFYSISMLSSYFKMSARSLMAYRGTAAINIVGLVIGIASALVLVTVIRFERSFDQFHSNTGNIFRIVRVGKDHSEFRSGISYPVPLAVRQEISTVEKTVSMQYFGGASVYRLDPTGKTITKFQEVSGCVLVEPSFFDVFDFKGTNFKWISGNPTKALNDPYSIVLTETLAKKYFGNEDPLGQTLLLMKNLNCKVTGIISDLPANTDFPFSMLISYSTLNEMAGDRMNDWYSVNDSHQAFIVTSSGVTKEEVERQIAKVHATHTPKDLHESRFYLLQNLKELHTDARFGNYGGRTISYETLLGLGSFALFILLAACINYINLATAQSAMRSKEIGVRKVMGGNRKNLIIQFITETFLLVVISGFLALLLSEILISNFQSLLNLRYKPFNFLDPFILLTLTVISAMVTVLAGSYPSILISRFNPISALNNKLSGRSFSGIGLRKILVVLQFTITQVLGIGTFVVVSQMRYFQNRDMGFTKEAVVTLSIPEKNTGKLEVLANELRKKRFVSSIAYSFTLPSGRYRNQSYSGIGKPGTDPQNDYIVFEYQSIDSSFLSLYDIKLVAGRSLTLADTVGNVLVNETVVKNLSLGNAETAVGAKLDDGGTNVTIVGVVKDFYSNSLKEGVDNLVMYVNPGNYTVLSVRLDFRAIDGSVPGVIHEIETTWSSVYPEHIFSYQFLDENINAYYRQEQKYTYLFEIFTVIFLLIGCLGLYGLVTFVVNRKGREVAIRKVMGASMSNILILFSKEYVQLIAISFAVAAPLSFYLSDNWLKSFPNHIDLKWWYFVAPGMIVLMIAFLVVSTKSLGAARINPVDKLKYE